MSKKSKSEKKRKRRKLSKLLTGLKEVKSRIPTCKGGFRFKSIRDYDRRENKKIVQKEMNEQYQLLSHISKSTCTCSGAYLNNFKYLQIQQTKKNQRKKKVLQDCQRRQRLSKFVVDTNVIMTDPNCISKLGGQVILTSTVLEELDNHKSDNGEVGRNVREFARIIDKNDIKNYELWESYSEDEFGDKIETNDDKIIYAAYVHEATLVTNDILMSIKARTKGIKTTRYEPVNIIDDSSYTGLLDIRGSKTTYGKEVVNLKPNQFLLADDGLHVCKNERPKRINKDKKVWDIKHKNVEQRCAIEALMDDSIKLVTISGKAGTGKTLMAIACGLEKVITESVYSRLLVSRPVVPMGNDLGYLPGDINEKLGPWMQPIFDNIDFLFNMDGKKKDFDKFMELENSGLLKVEALTYIRGRSIPQQYLIIDEAQNLSKHEVKTIITRAGEGTKIILTGDPDQIDNPKLDSINNGLTYVIEKFKDEKIAAHITFKKGERSELADIASEIL